MSDHEAWDADEWEDRPPDRGPPVPKQPPETYANVTYRPKPVPALKRAPNNSVRTADRANLPISKQSTYHSKIVGSLSRSAAIQPEPDIDSPPQNAAQASWARREKPTAEYPMSIPWASLLANVGPGRDLRWAKMELNRISRETNSFIDMPGQESNKIWLWGNETQVTNAIAMLESTISFLCDTRGERHIQWAKIHALDGRREDRNQRQARVNEIAEQHRNLIAATDFDYEYWLLWPSRGMDIEQLILEHDSTTMEGLRRQYWCRIDYDRNNSFVHVLANEERKLITVVSRLIGIAKEMIASVNQAIKLNLANAPSATAYRDWVELAVPPEMDLAMVRLHGDALPEEEIRDWEGLVQKKRRSNRKASELAILKCLQSLPYPQRQIRMRLHFGRLGFETYQLPADGGKSRDIDDFFEMLTMERTTLRLRSLSDNPFDKGLLNRCSEATAFSQITETYAVHFVFEPEPGKKLRLETEFQPAMDKPDELELREQRWLEFRPGSGHEVLQVNLLDFEKCDWQLNLISAGLCNNERILGQLEHFRSRIGFRVLPEGIRAQPQRRAIYPVVSPRPTRVIEMSTIKYRFKDTDGVFELTREDEYLETRYNSSCKPPQVSWSASYYYPEWDNLLGEYAYLQPGAEVEWQRSLETFFPDATASVKPRGLKKFMKEVAEIQEILSAEMENGVDGSDSCEVDLQHTLDGQDQIHPGGKPLDPAENELRKKENLFSGDTEPAPEDEQVEPPHDISNKRSRRALRGRGAAERSRRALRAAKTRN